MWIEGYVGMSEPGARPRAVGDESGRTHGRAGADIGNSHKVLPTLFRERPELTFDLITVDGDHTPRGARRDILDVLPRLRIGGVLVFDDVRHANPSQARRRLGRAVRRSALCHLGVRRRGLRRRARDPTVVVLVAGRAWLSRQPCLRAAAARWPRSCGAGRPEVELASRRSTTCSRDPQPARSFTARHPASVPARSSGPTADRTASVAVLERLLARLSALARPPRLVFISSAAVTGSLGGSRLRRTSRRSRCRRTDVTAWSARTWSRNTRTRVESPGVNLRVFSAYGEGLGGRCSGRSAGRRSQAAR